MLSPYLFTPERLLAASADILVPMLPVCNSQGSAPNAVRHKQLHILPHIPCNSSDKLNCYMQKSIENRFAMGFLHS